MKSYDPKLREAMHEIDEILHKYDIGGFISLCSRTHTEFKMPIDTPTWSNIRYVKNGDAVHIKLHSKSDHKNTEDTVAMLASMRDMAGTCFTNCDAMLDMIEKHVKVTHIRGEIRNDDRDN